MSKKIIDKKGQEFIADIFAYLLFVFIVIIFLVLMAYKKDFVEKELKKQIMVADTKTELVMLLRQPIEYNGKTYNLAEAISEAEYYHEFRKNIGYELGGLFKEKDLKNCNWLSCWNSWCVKIKYHDKTTKYPSNHNFFCNCLDNPNNPNCQKINDAITATTNIAGYKEDIEVSLAINYEKKEYE